MTDPAKSTADFFEAKYQSAPDSDPWNFATAAYELARYDAVIRALSGRRYAHAFEPGCSLGVLTQRLATLCDRVDACDFSPTAAAAASARCADIPGVCVRCATLDSDQPWARFDLVVMCEIGYYFTPLHWAELIQTMALAMQPGSVLLASHWLGNSNDHVQTGDAVHDSIAHPLLHRTLSERHEGFRLERWIRIST